MRGPGFFASVWLAALTVDTVIVWVALSLQSQEYTWRALLYWVLAVWGVSAFLWLRKTAVGQLWYWFYGRDLMINEFRQYLWKSDFPEYHNMGDVMGWVEGVALDAENPFHTRLAAQRMFSEYWATMQTTKVGGFSVESAVKAAARLHNKALNARHYLAERK